MKYCIGKKGYAMFFIGGKGGGGKGEGDAGVKW